MSLNLALLSAYRNPAPLTQRGTGASVPAPSTVQALHTATYHSVPPKSRITTNSKDGAKDKPGTTLSGSNPSQSASSWQQTEGTPSAAGTGKHYVTFHFTDGDNVEWLDGEHPGFEFFSAGNSAAHVDML